MPPSKNVRDGMRCCTRCGEWKPATLEYFPKSYCASPDGLVARCRSCVSKNMQEYVNRRKAVDPEFADRIRERDRLNYHKNPEKDRASNKAWRERNKEQRAEYARGYYQTHKAEMNESSKEYYRQHRDQLRELNKKYRVKNAEYFREELRKRQKENPEKFRAYEANRRARKKATGGTYTREDVQLQYESQRGLCWWCGKPVGNDYHIDHRIPLSRGGSNDARNLCIACPHCNAEKHNKLPHEWNGRLL